MSRIFQITAWLLIASVLFTGCGQKKDSNTIGDSEGKIQMGVCFDSLVIERWQRDRDVFVSRVQELGAVVNVQNAGGDVKKQKEQIEYFISRQVDVIVIVAIDTKALTEQVKKAKAQGIKVIAYDRILENCDVDLYASFDNFEVGNLLAKAVRRQFPDGADVLEIMGSPKDYNVAQIEAGLEDGLKNTSCRVLEKTYAENWLAEKAFETVSEFYKKGKNCDVVICGNDDLAAQAVKALSEQRKAGSVFVIGQDGDLAACQRIVEGTQGATVFKNVDQLAKETAEAAIRLAEGEEPGTTQKISDGTYKVDYLCLKPELVTKENMDSVIIDGGFHAREDVYLNTKKK